MDRAPRVGIVGGGIAGLAAAYFLQQRAPERQVVLIEADHHVGGKVATECIEDFVLEAGPDSFLASKPGGIELCYALGLEQRLQGTDERHRHTFVLADGRLHPMPEGLSGLIPARLEPLQASSLFSEEGKRRLAAEPDIPPRRETSDESLRSFIVRRFGDEAYDRLIEPLMAGIYGGDGAWLSVRATFPHLAEMERSEGSLLRAIAAQAPAEESRVKRPGFLTPVGGMGEIITALTRRLTHVKIVTGTVVDGLHRVGQGYRLTTSDGDQLPCDAVILATPAPVSGSLLRSLDTGLADILQQIPYASSATVSLAYTATDVPGDLDGYGYVVPRAEERPILACTWVSSKFRHRAPPGYHLLRMFVGRFGREEALAGSDEEIAALARQEARYVLGIAAEPVLERVYRWPHAMPQYTLGHMDRLAHIERSMHELPGIYLAGSSYRGVGIPDCIVSGERAAEAAAGDVPK